MVELTRVIRRPGPCLVPVGHHFGRWELYSLDHTEFLATGDLRGTESYNSDSML